MSDLDVLALGGMRQAAPPRSADTSLTTVGTVLDVNADQALVLVSVHESEGSWVPAVAGRYVRGGSCVVLANPFAGGRSERVLGPVTPRMPWVLATVTALTAGPDRAVVTWDDRQWTLPFIPAVLTVGAEAWVGLDDWGRPVLVHGPSDDAPPAPPMILTTPAVPARSAQATVTIFPQWSGSYRSGSGWDRWNTGRYGGRSTLYQGNGFGSGQMKGLATYGDQLANLAAISIDRVRVILRGVGLSGASGPAVVQGSPHGSQPGGAPTSAGETATAGPDESALLTAAMREDLRTGRSRGLALVGPNYWAVAGAGNTNGLALEVTYTRAV